MKAIGYARVSTPRQSLDLQIAKLEAFAKENGYEIEIFSEKKSGKGIMNKLIPEAYEHERPELWKAIQKCKENACPMIVLNLDRLSRAEKDGVWLFSRIDTIISINEGIVSLDEARDLFKQAEAEREKCRIRQKSIMEESKQKLIAKRQEFYKEVFEKEGNAEYVFEYVVGEIHLDRRTRRSRWEEGDLMSCIMCAWLDAGLMNLTNATLEESTIVAECALSYIATRKSRKDCSIEYPTEGWHWDENEGCQMENEIGG